MTSDRTADLQRLVDGSLHDPHSVLGPHLVGKHVEVRVLRPLATSVTVVTADERVALRHEHGGVWHGMLAATAVPDYRLEVDYDGSTVKTDDPYRFLPTLGEIDLHLISEGRHEQLWQVLGAHERRYDTPQGLVD
ncbi:MAG: 1,4-alpha-glucan branching enzyme, partial [Propionibacteriales bacterium]|nr:1,4-alpha-glucan branching enzyme [Propionibacteriales bacterium]